MADEPAPRSFADTPQFKVMRVAVGAANPFIRAMLARGSGGPMANSVLLLRFRGRRSGTWFTTPVGYVRDGDVVVVVTHPSYRWWRNVIGGADVDVRLNGGWRIGRARIVQPDDADYDATVALQVAKRGPGMLRGFGVAVDERGHVAAKDRDAAAKAAYVVRIELDGPAPDKR